MNQDRDQKCPEFHLPAGCLLTVIIRSLRDSVIMTHINTADAVDRNRSQRAHSRCSQSAVEHIENVLQSRKSQGGCHAVNNAVKNIVEIFVSPCGELHGEILHQFFCPGDHYKKHQEIKNPALGNSQDTLQNRLTDRLQNHRRYR